MLLQRLLIIVAVWCTASASRSGEAFAWAAQRHAAAAATAGRLVARANAPAPASSPTFPLPSALFTGNTPFHHRVTALLRAGARIMPAAITANWWAAGIKDVNEPNQSPPVYIGRPGDPAYKVACSAAAYKGAGVDCNAGGKIAHVPAGAVPQDRNTDKHLATVDVALGAEIDGWGGFNNSNFTGPAQCVLTGGKPGTLNCAWGGSFALNSSGLGVDGSDVYSNSTAASYALGIFELTAQDLLNAASGTPISHALGMGVSCIDPPENSEKRGVYPSYKRKSDNSCPSGQEPNLIYGDLLAIKPNVDLATRGGSVYCQAVLHALQTYGAYVVDVGPGYGAAIQTENPDVETYEYGNFPNPWYTTIEPALAAAGEGANPGPRFTYSSCLNHTTLDDWETIELNQRGTAALPQKDDAKHTRGGAGGKASDHRE
ncbi:MAG: hypothetical protein ABSB70_14970 [Candidatus Velthaea sp.]